MSHPALTQLRALRYFAEIPALDPAQLDWLLLEDSMTKRFEQQGKKVSVTVIREQLCRATRCCPSYRSCRKSLATGCGKFYFAQMVNHGLRGALWCQNQRYLALNWHYKNWVRPRWGATCLHHQR